jgi:hypothetical protein
VGAPDGSGWALGTPAGEDPEELGALVGERLLRAGGAELLAAARRGIDTSEPIPEQQPTIEDGPT